MHTLAGGGTPGEGAMCLRVPSAGAAGGPPAPERFQPRSSLPWFTAPAGCFPTMKGVFRGPHGLSQWGQTQISIPGPAAPLEVSSLPLPSPRVAARRGGSEGMRSLG